MANLRVCSNKVRTGCWTCKARHLKCGEEKPQCNRCASTGRVCGGYPTYNNELHDVLLDMMKGINNIHERGRAMDQAHIDQLQANCKKICMKHQTDLHIFHQCLLEAHRHDLPSGSCRLLEERYKAYEEQLRLYHARLQWLLDKGAGLSPLPERLQKTYKLHEKILDELHGRLLSTYEGKAGWSFFDMLERASQEKNLRVLHSSLLNLHKQVARRDMLLHDFSHMQTSSIVDGIETERPTLDSYPGPIQEFLPSQALGLDSDIEEMYSQTTGIRHKLQAEQLLRRVLAGREKEPRESHPLTLTSVNNLALVLQYQGKYEQAEQLHRRALAGNEKELGESHPLTLTSMDNLAVVLQYQGKYEQAEQLYRLALAAREKELGESHPDTLTSLDNLAWVLWCQGKYKHPITSSGGSLGPRWVSQDSKHKLNIRSGVNSHHASHDSEQLAGIGKALDKLITPLCPVSSDGDVSEAETPDEDSKPNTTEAKSTSSHEPVEPYEQDTHKKPLAFGAERVPASTPGETTESGGPVQPMASGDTFVHLSPRKRARFLQQGPNSVDEMSPLPKFFCGIYTWYSTHDTFQGIVPQSISSTLSRAVEYTSEFSSWASVTCRKNLPFLEPPLENGKVRVRWTCRCGRQLYDDFKEARPGAAEDLGKLLDHPQAAKSRKDFIIIATRLVEMLYYLGEYSAGMALKSRARLDLALVFLALASLTLVFLALASPALDFLALDFLALDFPALTSLMLAFLALEFFALTSPALALLVRDSLVRASLVRTSLVRTSLVLVSLALLSLALVPLALVSLVLAPLALVSPSLASLALISLVLASLLPACLVSAWLGPASVALASLALACLALASLAQALLALASERSPSRPIPSSKPSAPLATSTVAAAPGHQPARGHPAMLQSGPDQGKLDLRQVDPNVSSQASKHESLFLLTCVTISHFATSLLQVDLKQPLPILSDRQLLELLRTHYHRLRRSWRRRLLSFQTLTSIEFVQFELHRKSIVDIRKRDDIPPEDRKDEYQYRPIPAEVIPPVGRNYLMHIYHHPEDADSETVCLTRFPKRVKERLKLGGTDVPVGWGIEFVEGVHWNKVWCFGFAIVLISLVMGIVWSCVKRDVQSGFGIAGFMMAFLTFMVGMLQAANA
ncbi:hypothetical protein GJ744_010240 [Endocarpon pusillum]|uniref:Zn(2)-C6 fungal-type domain-containing protein n=1 Tax=Endocarpon pusillum TaxID=364733 RepID=A0A8H7E364_9EURO|nr:hypothetical protein GJ744_010240 [Endocarpon pusillum]